MRVKVEVYGSLRNVIGWRSIEIELDEGSTLGQLLDLLVEQKPEVKEMMFEGENLRDYLKVLVDGRDCRLLGGLRTKLEDGSTISIFPPAGGG
ncbi:MAG: MoaD/ThiS family protein [Candidatus Nezhaarchaeota archaeon]|nr:MoaD/ThiS family protein [Candidatus Nezhaarchaeota archaeon]